MFSKTPTFLFMATVQRHIPFGPPLGEHEIKVIKVWFRCLVVSGLVHLIMSSSKEALCVLPGPGKSRSCTLALFSMDSGWMVNPKQTSVLLPSFYLLFCWSVAPFLVITFFLDTLDHPFRIWANFGTLENIPSIWPRPFKMFNILANYKS